MLQQHMRVAFDMYICEVQNEVPRSCHTFETKHHGMSI